MGPGLASREWQPFQVKLPVEPMPGAPRTAAPASQRQGKRQEKRHEKRREKIVPLMFACGYRLGGRRTDSAASYPPLEGRAIAYDQLQPCVDTVVISHDLSAGRPCERRDPHVDGLKREKRLWLRCRNESPRRMGPCVRSDDTLERYAYENSICDGPGSTLRQRKLAPRIGACRLNGTRRLFQSFLPV